MDGLRIFRPSATATVTGPSLAVVAGPSATGKKWAGRRQPRPASSSAVATADAAAQISVSAECEKAYYTAKLEMDRKEHEIWMRIINTSFPSFRT